MKRNDQQALREKTIEQLGKEAAAISEKLRGFLVEKRMRKEKNMRLGKKLRNDRAVMLTIMGELAMKKGKV